MRGSPRSLDELRAVTDQVEQAKAAAEYIQVGLAKIAEARAIRNAAIVGLAAEYGSAETARLTGVNLSTVRDLRRGQHAAG